MRRCILSNQQKNICDICSNIFKQIYLNEIQVDGQNKIVCDNCLKNLPHCYQCGQYLSDLQQIGGQNFCYACAYDYTQCDNCDCLLKIQESYKYGNETYCEQCFHELFYTCEICGDVVQQDKICQTYDQRGNHIIVCKDCKNHYVAECYGCNCDVNLYHDNYGYYREEYLICDNCMEEDYGYCVACDALCQYDELQLVDGQYYCQECKPDKVVSPQDGDDNQQIYEYDTKLDIKFKKKLNQAQTEEYIGVQLQIVAQQPNGLRYFIKQAKKNKKIIFKRDASIGSGGIQINTQPATYQYHLSVMGWQRIFSLMNQYDVNDTTNCGIHFHISKDNFTTDQLKVLDYFVNNCSYTLGVIGGRDYKNNGYCKAIPDKDVWGENKIDRYQAVNFKNANTVQLRFPKSTSNYNQFKKLLRMVHNICKFSKMFTFQQIKQLDQTQLKYFWNEILKLVD